MTKFINILIIDMFNLGMKNSGGGEVVWIFRNSGATCLKGGLANSENSGGS